MGKLNDQDVTAADTAPIYPYETANGLPRMSHSSLRNFIRSPAHMLADKEKQDEEEKRDLIIGRAFHCKVLEPDNFAERFVTIPDDAKPRPSESQLNAKYMAVNYYEAPKDAPYKRPGKSTLNAVYMTSPKNQAEHAKRTDVMAAVSWYEEFDKMNEGKVLLSESDMNKRREITEYKNWWDKFNEDNKGKDYLTKADMEMLAGMVAAFEAEEDACEMLLNRTATEQKLRFTDPDTGIELLVIVDIVGKYKARARVPEVKTTTNADPDVFRHDILKYKIHMQLAIQIDALRAHGYQITDNDAHIIAIEKKAPYGISVIDVDAHTIQRGRYDYKNALVDVVHWYKNGCKRESYRFRIAGGRFTYELPESMHVSNINK